MCSLLLEYRTKSRLQVKPEAPGLCFLFLESLGKLQDIPAQLRDLIDALRKSRELLELV